MDVMSNAAITGSSPVHGVVGETDEDGQMKRCEKHGCSYMLGGECPECRSDRTYSRRYRCIVCWAKNRTSKRVDAPSVLCPRCGAENATRILPVIKCDHPYASTPEDAGWRMTTEVRCDCGAVIAPAPVKGGARSMTRCKQCGAFVDTTADTALRGDCPGKEGHD